MRAHRGIVLILAALALPPPVASGDVLPATPGALFEPGPALPGASDAWPGTGWAPFPESPRPAGFESPVAESAIASAPLGLLPVPSPLDYVIVARSGEREARVIAQALVPATVDIDGDGAPALPHLSPVAGAPGADFVVVASGVGGLPLLGERFTFTVRALPSGEGRPVEVWLARRASGDGAFAFAGFRAPSAPREATITLAREGDAMLATVASTGGAGIEVVAGRGEERASLALAPSPALAELRLARADGEVAVAWTLPAGTRVRARASGAEGALDVAWDDAPATLEATVSRGNGASPDGATLAMLASAPSGPLRLSAASPGGALALSLGKSPASFEVSFEDGAARYDASEPLPALDVEVSRGARSVRVAAEGAPPQARASLGAGGFALDAPASFARLTLLAGEAAQCERAPGSFLFARAGAHACAALSLARVRSVAVDATEGSLRARAVLDAPDVVALRARGGERGSSAELALALPAAIDFSIENGPARFSLALANGARSSARGVVWRGDALPVAPPAPRGGLAIATGGPFALALDLPNLPADLTVEAFGSIGARRAPASREGASRGAVAIALPPLAEGERLSVALGGTADAPIVEASWIEGAPGLAALGVSTSDGWVRALLPRLPSGGRVTFDDESVTFDLPDAPPVEVRAFASSAKPPRALLADAPAFASGALVASTGDASGALVRLPGAREGRVDWSDGLAIEYRELEGDPAFAVHARSADGARADGALALPRDLEARIRPSRDGFELEWRGSSGPGDVALDVGGPSGAGRARITDLPREFRVAWRGGDAPALEYEASAAGADVSAGGAGDAFGLGRGGSLAVVDAPDALAIERGSDGSVRLEASGPVDASIALGEKRWGDGLLGFSTESTRLALDGVEALTVRPGGWGRVIVEGRGGTLAFEHDPADLTAAVLIVAQGAPRDERAGKPPGEPTVAEWNRAELALDHGPWRVAGGFNPLLPLQIAPFVSLFVAAGLAALALGAAFDRRRQRKRAERLARGREGLSRDPPAHPPEAPQP